MYNVNSKWGTVSVAIYHYGEDIQLSFRSPAVSLSAVSIAQWCVPLLFLVSRVLRRPVSMARNVWAIPIP